MENLFELLNDIPAEIEKAGKKFFTDALIIALIQEEFGGLDGAIKNIFDQTKDESKRVYLLADYIRREHAHFREADIYEELFNLSVSLKNSKNEHLGDIIRSLADWISKTTFSVDCFEVAKALINRYKKQNKVSKKKAA